MGKLSVFSNEEVEVSYVTLQLASLPAGWAGTALDVLRLSDLPAHEAIRLVAGPRWLPAQVYIGFCAWCVRRSLSLLSAESANPLISQAAACVEAYARGEVQAAERANLHIAMNVILRRSRPGVQQFVYGASAWALAGSLMGAANNAASALTLVAAEAGQVGAADGAWEELAAQLRRMLEEYERED